MSQHPAGGPDPATGEALEIARALAAAGVPVFLAHPGCDDAGQWLPDGGRGGCGYWLPRAWETTVADPSVIDLWRPGMALAAVMGHALDGVDVDPRNSGDASAAELAAAGCWPMVVGRQATPSGGWHDLVDPLRMRSRDGVMPGIDVKAGLPDGTGRGFLFLAPTVKLSNGTGELASSRWQVPPMRDELAASDSSGQLLDERVEALPRQGRPVRAGFFASVTAELADAAARPEGFRDETRLRSPDDAQRRLAFTARLAA